LLLLPLLLLQQQLLLSQHPLQVCLSQQLSPKTGTSLVAAAAAAAEAVAHAV
jgi:hypothetical protein